MFHLGSIDWLEDTPDTKNTTHMLIICAFQPHNDESTNDEVINSTSIMESEQNEEHFLPPPANKFQQELLKI